MSSVFIGGGTPSIIDAGLIYGILDTVRSHYRLAENAEISIECNPASVLKDKLQVYSRAGVNRLSIGLQSADNSELRMLGRVHSFEEFLKSFESARMLGFNNINVDLISCIPMQSINTWKKTLRSVVMLKPEHVSVYNLIIEEGTPFYEMYQKKLLMLPDEDEQALIDSFTAECLSKAGYHRYEFSNWARSGYESEHNKGYWTGVPYLGFGLGASSFFEGVRWRNTSDYPEYMGVSFEDAATVSGDGIRQDIKGLSNEDLMEEFMILGLRMIEGVRPSVFLSRFGRQLENVFGSSLEKHMANGLLAAEEDRIFLTERGIEISNVVLSDFLLH